MQAISIIFNLAQVPDEGLIESGIDTINKLGSIDPITLILAGFAILVGFMLLISVYEWRRERNDLNYRNALQAQAKALQDQSERDQLHRQKTDDKLELELDKRRQLEDIVAQLERKMDGIKDDYDELKQENEALKKRPDNNESPDG